MPMAPQMELLDRLISALVGGVKSVRPSVVGVAGDCRYVD